MQRHENQRETNSQTTVRKKLREFERDKCFSMRGAQFVFLSSFHVNSSRNYDFLQCFSPLRLLFCLAKTKIEKLFLFLSLFVEKYEENEGLKHDPKKSTLNEENE